MDNMNHCGLLNSLVNMINAGSDDEAHVLLARYFLQNYNRLHECNIHDIAEECYVSRATVRRLAQSLGYGNFKDLKIQLNNFHNDYNFYQFSQTDMNGQSAAVQLYKMARDCDRYLTPEFLNRAVTKIHTSRQIIFLTSDIYNNQCSEFQKAMIISGKIVRVISNRFKNHLTLKNLCQEDMLIVPSVAGFFAEVSFDMVSTINAYKVLITTSRKQVYENCYHEVWYLSRSEQSSKRSVYTIYALEYYLENILAAYIKKYGKK